jgi:hypothetical protein
MLEIVEHEQQLLLAQVVLEGRMQGPVADVSQFQGLADGRHYERNVAQGCQADEDHTVREELGAITRRFQGKARLSDAAYTRER